MFSLKRLYDIKLFKSEYIVWEPFQMETDDTRRTNQSIKKLVMTLVKHIIILIINNYRHKLFVMFLHFTFKSEAYLEGLEPPSLIFWKLKIANRLLNLKNGYHLFFNTFHIDKIRGTGGLSPLQKTRIAPPKTNMFKEKIYTKQEMTVLKRLG